MIVKWATLAKCLVGDTGSGDGSMMSGSGPDPAGEPRFDLAALLVLTLSTVLFCEKLGRRRPRPRHTRGSRSRSIHVQW